MSATSPGNPGVKGRSVFRSWPSRVWPLTRLEEVQEVRSALGTVIHVGWFIVRSVVLTGRLAVWFMVGTANMETLRAHRGSYCRSRHCTRPRRPHVTAWRSSGKPSEARASITHLPSLPCLLLLFRDHPP